MLRALLSLLNSRWRSTLEQKIAAAIPASDGLVVPDGLQRLLTPPVPVSKAADAAQERDFLTWRSPTYVAPMSDGVVEETLLALQGANSPEPFDAATVARMALTTTLAYMVKRDGDAWVLDLAALSLFPYRPLTISQFRFDLERGDFAIVDIGGTTHRPGDASWETALTHVMCWATVSVPAAAHNWVHFALPDVVAAVHHRSSHRVSALWKVLAPHLRFTSRINAQALWTQLSTDNAPTFRKALVPWLAMPFFAEQFRGGILRNTQRHYAALDRHFELPQTFDTRIPYFRFLREYFEVISRFTGRLDAELEDAAWDELAAGVSAELPGFDAIPRSKALAVLLWQASVVHTADHLTYFDAAMRHGFMRVPRTLRRTFTARHVSAWDRWKTRNFLKTFVTFNAHPGLDQRLLNVDAYGFEPGSALHAAAQGFKGELLELDGRLQAEGLALVPVDRLIQSVCL